MVVRRRARRSPGAEEEIGRFFSVSLDLLCIADFNGYFKLLNPAWEKTLGFPTAELLSKPFVEFVHPEDRPATLAEAGKLAAQEHDTVGFANRYRCADGSYKWLVWKARSDQRRRLIYAAARDVTDEQRAEEELRRADARFRAAVESSPNGTLMIDRDGLIVLVNREVERMFGYSRDELLGRPIELLLPEPLRKRHLEHRATFYADAQTRAMGAGRDLYGLRKDGTKIPVEIGLAPVATEEGIFVLSSIVDITERKRAEETLKESKERLDLAMESAQMGSWDLDLVHDTAVRSLRHDQIFGYPSLRPEWSSEIFLTHVLPEDRELVKERFQEAFATGQFEMECRILWPDQSVHWIAAQGHVYYNEKREPIRMMGVVRDVSERKRAEQILAERSTQLEAANQELEAFAYSVSHDLRAPLRSIDGFSQVLLEDHGERLEDSGRDALGRVRAAAARMARLIDDLLKLSRVTRAELQRARVDLSEMARGVVAELALSEPDRHVDTRIADGVVVQGDPSLLRLVLENLLGNAFKFTSKTGEARVEFGVERQNGAQVYYVRDNGAGFDAAYADKLFGAFQRLHSEAEFPGTGIGLATVQRIVHRHGGRVWAEGAVDGGATFRFTL
jgi:PAS domain S-box-containing protein